VRDESALLVYRPRQPVTARYSTHGDGLGRGRHSRCLFKPGCLCEHNRCLNLPVRNVPVGFEEAFFLGVRDLYKAVPLIEADCPDRIRPRPYKDGTARNRMQMREHLAADTLVLLIAANVRVANEGYVAYRLDTHDSSDWAGLFVRPELNAIVDFMPQLIRGHIGIAQAIGWKMADVGSCAIIDGVEDRSEVRFITGADSGRWRWGAHVVMIGSRGERDRS
jgi:hypothetical protein